MSLFTSIHVDCPACDHTNTMDAVGSVNADRRPDLRDDIIADAFQIITCAECSEGFRLQPEFNYLDVENGLWILALDVTALADHLIHEDRARDLFDISYGANAAPAAQEVGEALRCRVTFGWPAVREKVLTRIEGLDDIVLEMMKLNLLRRLPEAPIDFGVELRLMAVVDDMFELAWVMTESEEVQSIIRINRDAYDGIAENRVDWAGVEALLADGPFCDMQKLFLGQGREAPQAAE